MRRLRVLYNTVISVCVLLITHGAHAHRGSGRLYICADRRSTRPLATLSLCRLTRAGHALPEMVAHSAAPARPTPSGRRRRHRSARSCRECGFARRLWRSYTAVPAPAGPLERDAPTEAHASRRDTQHRPQVPHPLHLGPVVHLNGGYAGTLHRGDKSSGWHALHSQAGCPSRDSTGCAPPLVAGTHIAALAAGDTLLSYCTEVLRRGVRSCRLHCPSCRCGEWGDERPLMCCAVRAGGVLGCNQCRDQCCNQCNGRHCCCNPGPACP